MDKNREDALIIGGLLAISIAILFHIDSKDSTNIFHDISMYILVISIPILVCALLIFSSETELGETGSAKRIKDIVIIVGIGLAILGVIVFTFSIGLFKGIAFFFVSAICLAAWAEFRSRSEKNRGK